MIEHVADNDSFLGICEKLSEVRDNQLSQGDLMHLLQSGVYGGKVQARVSREGGALTGCVVTVMSRDLSAVPVLYVIFLWVDRHKPHLIKQYMDAAENLARQEGAKRISMTTVRNARAIERRYGQYGYHPAYTVVEKAVE